ncbi:MAG: exodeoxyribonuclease VII large subunit [Actinomyces sp.]|nr:exodeoxyribonuclease VII large subunit [Actinomyces sp.]MCI1661818.1 exodeoxyribonuclease VII large subunit [Actinomyces sp.]MCI1690660.1 exodeoxyribonuclease VII large subunit [Actinomyces sp.]MCI1786740.1 exodeoxyribonuclease VII large subunit [Actinomyces sp.]MCI1829118.1 exodeoxyribonuclease VII large subunit [Actinomyces sp.]
MRRLTENIKVYVDRMSEMWVEGQVVEYKPRPGTKMAFFVLRDTEADTSMTVSTFPGVLDRTGPGFDEGARVVVRVKPTFWERRGTLNLRAAEVHLQGIGDLLARIEELRHALDAEGLFAEGRKVPLPFLPQRVGLICGRNAKAKDDVIVNATARWPGITFEIREVAVQGPSCVPQVSAAMAELDALPEVDVIVVARGGGAVEDLLPFSDEVLVRAAAAVRTPLVSAIGHEGDAPLLDLVADYRASTPTDAARRIVPDRQREHDGLAHAVSQMRAAVRSRLAREREHLTLLASRPVLLRPTAALEQHRALVDAQAMRLAQSVSRRLATERTELTRAQATLAAISPQATLDRGYAMLRTPSGDLVRDAAAVKKGDLLEAVLARGRLVAQVFGTNPGPAAPSGTP